MPESPIAVAAGRKSGRVRLSIPCEIQGVRVPVRDLSLDGCRVLTTEAHSVGETIQVTLRLASKIEVPAEIRWVEPEVAQNRFVLGCHFVHTSGSREALQGALQTMASAIDSAARKVK